MDERGETMVTRRKKDACVLGGACVLGVVLFFLYGILDIRGFIASIKEMGNSRTFLYGVLVAFVGNAGVLASIPYAPAMAFLALSLSTFRAKVFFVVVCGIAAGLGEMVCYGIGTTARKKMGEESKRKFDRLNERLGRGKGFLAFLAGVSPIPDEFIIVPLASGKYSFRKTVLYDTLGKVLLSVPVVFLGPRFFDSLAMSPVSFSLFAPFFVITYYLFIRIDWEGLLGFSLEEESGEKRGERG